MGEDMTYTGAEPTRAQLAARVAELERQQLFAAHRVRRLRYALEQYEKWFAGTPAAQAIPREIAGIANNALWADDFDKLVWNDGKPWTAQTPDDTDAPLKLAPVEDDE